MTKTVFLIISLLFANYISAENIIPKYSELITIGEDSEFIRSVSVVTKADEADNRISFLYNSYESYEVKNIYYLDSKNKKRKVRNKDLIETDLFTEAFYSDHKMCYWSVPKTRKLEYQYVITNPNLFELGRLDLDVSNDFEQVKYKIILPDHLFLHFDTSYVRNNKVLRYKQKDSLNYTIYQFEYKKKTSLVRTSKNTNNSIPNVNLIRIIVCPKRFQNYELKYFTLEYLKRIEDKIQLSENLKSIVDEICQGTTNVDTASSRLLDYIWENFTYIDIENGVNGYIPRLPDKIYSEKKGDCKDFSLFLHAALKYKGFTSNLAISSTISHQLDMTFPSISSGNHVICVVNKDNRVRYLDATDKFSIYPKPSVGIQGKHILILYDEPLCHYVKPVDYKENTIDISVNLVEIGKGKFVGDFIFVSNNYASTYFKYYASKNDSLKFKKKMKKYLEKYLCNFELELKSYKLSDSSVMFTGNASVFVDRIENQYFLKTEFLEMGSPLNSEYLTTNSIYFMNTLNLKKEIKVNFNQKIQNANPLNSTLDFSFASYSLSMENPSESELKITQNYALKENIIEKRNISKFNQIYHEINLQKKNTLIISN